MEEALKSTIKVGKYEYLSFNGSLWVKIFYHNFENRATFANETEALNVNTDDKYSILGEISNEHRINGKFEFVLYYPSIIGKYNQWRQTKNPSKEYDYAGKNKAVGYEPVHIDWTNNSWGGLVRSLPANNIVSSFIDGSVGVGAWFYCIGKFPKTDGWDNSNVPGPVNGVDEVYLLMKVHDMKKRYRQTCKRHRFDTVWRCLFLVNLLFS